MAVCVWTLLPLDCSYPDVEASLYTFSVFAVASVFVVFLFAWVQAQRPIEQLPLLDLPRSHQPQAIANDVDEQSRRQIKGPAIGLLVTGIVNWMATVLTLLMAFYLSSNAMPGPNDGLQLHGSIHVGLFGVSGDFQRLSMAGGVVLVATTLLLLCLSGFIIFAALKMKRLQGYGLAIAASILAIIISPGNVIGLPIGIWALVVLSHAKCGPRL